MTNLVCGGCRRGVHGKVGRGGQDNSEAVVAGVIGVRVWQSGRGAGASHGDQVVLEVAHLAVGEYGHGEALVGLVDAEADDGARVLVLEAAQEARLAYHRARLLHGRVRLVDHLDEHAHALLLLLLLFRTRLALAFVVFFVLAAVVSGCILLFVEHGLVDAAERALHVDASELDLIALEAHAQVDVGAVEAVVVGRVGQRDAAHVVRYGLDGVGGDVEHARVRGAVRTSTRGGRRCCYC